MTWNLYQRDDAGHTKIVVKDSTENVDGLDFVREATDSEAEDEITRRKKIVNRYHIR